MSRSAGPRNPNKGQRSAERFWRRGSRPSPRILDVRISRVPYSHLLDVAAFVWTARRIFARAAVRIPDEPEWDEGGLRMEIVR